MQFFLLVLLFCFFIFLFCLHYIGKDDYVLLRKNVNLDQLFNIAIATSVIGLFLARLIFILFHPKLIYLNPLVFLAIPYYPGLSLGGGIIGAILSMYIYCKQNRYPFWRIMDVYFLAFSSAIPFGIIGNLLLQGITIYSAIFMVIISFSLFVFFLKILHPKLLKNEIKDGRIGIYALLCYASFSILLSIINHKHGLFYFFEFEDLLSLIIFIASFLLFIQMEKPSKRVSK